MRIVYKYIITPSDAPEVTMPVNAKILSVQMQNHEMCVWAMVDTEARFEKRRFNIVGTGQPLKDIDAGCERRHISTVQDGSFVWHVFELDSVSIETL